MARKSYLERKLQGLNCMKINKRHYGSLDSLDSIPSTLNPNTKTKKPFKLFDRFGKKNAENGIDQQFTVSYEQVSNGNEIDTNERSRLLESRSNKKLKKSVKFYMDGSATSENVVSNAEKKVKGRKKKSGILKRTGKMIVRTCRLMTLGTPYMSHMSPDFPYNNHYPPDYRYYDFEKKEWDYSSSTSNYMGYGVGSPSLFF